MAYREIRVRPVVRYIVTEFTSLSADADGNGTSIEFGEFDNPYRANIVANMLAYDGPAQRGASRAEVAEAPKLKIATKLVGGKTYWALSFNDHEPAMWAAPLLHERETP